MKSKILQEIEKAARNQKEQRTFHGAEEFYEFLKTQGVRASLEDVKTALIDLSKQSKQELGREDLDAVAGGARVEVWNVVENNSQSVTIGSTVVIIM